MHGSDVMIKDDQKAGSIDIRGDILSGMKNGKGTASNTVINEKGETIEENTLPGHNLVGLAHLQDTVVRSNVEISLNNKDSVLFGNIYERHRIDGETIKRTDIGTNKQNIESFDSWIKLQIENEQQSLGGNVNLSLGNKASWYPQQKWMGWNYDFADTDFYEAYNKNTNNGMIPNKIDYNNISYSKLDFSDQYNLHVHNKDLKEYELTNSAYKNSTGKELSYKDLDPNKVNDLNVKDNNSSEDQIPFAYEKKRHIYNCKQRNLSPNLK